MLHHEVGAHDGEARMDAERRHGWVERYRFDEVAEWSWPKRKRVAAREDDFPDVRVDIEPVRNFTGDILRVLEGVVPPEAETATHTAGGRRDDEGAVFVLLQDAFGLARREVADGIIDESGGVLEFVCRR